MSSGVAGRVIVEIAVVVLCFFVLIVGTTHIDRAKFPANESIAVGALRTIYSENAAYATGHPEQGYARTLRDLSETLPSEQNGEAAQGLIGGLLASGVRSGYKFTYIPHSPNGTGRIDKYEVFADPLKPGRAAKRRFFVDDSGVVRWSQTDPASVTSPVLQ